jgi:hypothetical protein
VYDQNGNTVFFSTRTVRKDPQQLLLDYQEKFVEKGINSKVRLTTMEEGLNLPPERQGALTDDWSQAVLTGEIVPVHKRKDYVSMTGTLLQGSPTTPTSVEDSLSGMVRETTPEIVNGLKQAFLACGGTEAEYQAILRKEHDRMAEAACGKDDVCSEELWQKQKLSISMTATQRALKEGYSDCEPYANEMREVARKIAPESKMAAIRSIEMFKHPDNGTTNVTAVWSDDDYDMRKNLPARYGPDEDLFGEDAPPCPTCLPLWNQGGNGVEKQYGNTLYWSTDSVDQVYSWYAKEMPEEGWELSNGQRVLDTLTNRVPLPSPAQHVRGLHLSRGDDQMLVKMLWNPEIERTMVTFSRGANDPDGKLKK